jgi:predicted RNase H-like HicB family nuclease
MDTLNLMRSLDDLTIELEQETDGRWIADAIALPGVTVYGASKEEAIQYVKALALEVLLDRSEQNDEPPLTLHCDLC